ncbi:unnamed protein product [Symbiodinium sp. KB8]|nr:unnamed protein product [Symbiodinium sp. KB8]
MFLRLFLVLMGICGAVRQVFDQVISNDVGTMQKGAAGGGYVCECWTGAISKKFWPTAGVPFDAPHSTQIPEIPELPVLCGPCCRSGSPLF